MPDRRQLANAIRALSMDAVQKANSGHPGMPMGMADIAQVLWGDYLKHNPGNPQWADRDRFVLSNGHGSMLLYSLLYLTGYPLSIDEIKNFRQLGSHTAGHPEYEPHLGIETTTGPLGQGLANAVGMALAERTLAATFNRPGHEIVDHYTYVFAGDGCLMEGISHEVCSFAGTLELGKLIAFYDDNGISIDGEVQGWFTDDTPRRFEAYGWHVVPNIDGHDPDAVKRAIDAARAEVTRPSLLCCKTIIGWGAPHKQGTEATHGSALGEAEVAATRKNIDWPYEPFTVPEEIRARWNHRAAGARAEAAWTEALASYAKAFPELAREFERRVRECRLPADWRKAIDALIQATNEKPTAVATRVSSQQTLNALAPVIPELFGGSADLTGSNNTNHKGSTVVSRDRAAADYVHYGVREFGMTAIMTGIALHRGLVPYGGTFLVFSDYARNAVRMAALMKQRNILVYTHDSIGLGEDGPTHQPIEHLWSLRLIPNMSLWRPCDTVETAVAWAAALERVDGPTCLVLTRQALPPVARSAEQIAAIARGGYVVQESSGDPQCVVIATGSEVGLALDAAKALESKLRVRVVSMPSTDRFDAQPQAYRESVLARGVPRLAIEAGAPGGWWRYVGEHGNVVGMTTFGASAPAKALFEHFGFTRERIMREIEALT